MPLVCLLVGVGWNSLRSHGGRNEAGCCTLKDEPSYGTNLNGSLTSFGNPLPYSTVRTIVGWLAKYVRTVQVAGAA